MRSRSRHSRDVRTAYGFAALPDGGKEFKRLTGESFVPVLVLDDGEVIKDSKAIIAWAGSNPAGRADERPTHDTTRTREGPRR